MTTQTQKHTPTPRFANVSCAQCGSDLGPGDCGFSACGQHSVEGLLFNARMWREYATDWRRPEHDLRRRWVEGILRVDREECIRRARVRIAMAHRINNQARALAKASTP